MIGFYWLMLTFVFTVVSSSCKPRSMSEPQAEPQNRAIVGPSLPYVAKAIAPEQLASFELRRALGWQTAADVLAPVKTRGGKQTVIPTFQTWFDYAEFTQLFKQYYACTLSKEERANKGNNEVALANLIEKWHVKELPEWWRINGRYDKLLGQIDSDEVGRGLSGVSGRGFNLYSPALVKHLLLNYNSVLDCANGGFPTEVPLRGSCVGGEFPRDAVAIKTTWIRKGQGLGNFDHSLEGYKRMKDVDGGVYKAVGTSNVDLTSVYSAREVQGLQISGEYQLAGMHIMSKAIPDWLWISLWWSQDPNQDFGADRPAFFKAALNPDLKVFENYKMCVVSDFAEVDENTLAGPKDADPAFTRLAREMTQSLSATWCSNPFIEFRKGQGPTNCIGCHQLAGPGEEQDETVLHKKASSFPADYLWSYDNAAGGSFQSAISSTVADVDRAYETLLPGKKPPYCL